MRTWIEINKENALQNFHLFKSLINKDCLLSSVVKSNAYGHNLIDFSFIMEEAGVNQLAVDSIIEAQTLRKNGIKKSIHVLGYTPYDNIEDAALNDISLTIADFPSLNNLKKIKKRIKIHLKIDTGMYRQGFFLSELPEAVQIIKKQKNISLEGVYTHFAAAKDPSSPQYTLNQLKKFKEGVEVFHLAGFQETIKHASATSGTLLFPEAHLDMVRIGIGMYGAWPSKEIKHALQNKITLQSVLSWKTIVAQTKKIKKGEKLGYDLTEKLSRDSKIAILPVGYWHGFPLSLSKVGEVLLHGKRVKVLGRVCMDMVVVDITDIENVRIGDIVTLIGKEQEEEVSAEKLSLLAKTSSYEILTRLNSRIKRIVT